MTLYEQWDKYGEDSDSQEEYKKIVEEYLIKEKDVYDYLLSNRDEVVEGSVTDLAKKFDMDDIELVGFVDGINESLKNKYELETLTADSQVRFEIDYPTLYWEMLEAEAEWLYELEQWNDILPEEQRLKMKQDHKKSKTVIKGRKIGRNEPCTCGSGKKYKKCCGK